MPIFAVSLGKRVIFCLSEHRSTVNTQLQDVSENPNNPFIAENWDEMKKKLYMSGDETQASVASRGVAKL